MKQTLTDDGTLLLPLPTLLPKSALSHVPSALMASIMKSFPKIPAFDVLSGITSGPQWYKLSPTMDQEGWCHILQLEDGPLCSGGDHGQLQVHI